MCVTLKVLSMCYIVILILIGHIGGKGKGKVTAEQTVMCLSVKLTRGHFAGLFRVNLTQAPGILQKETSIEKKSPTRLACAQACDAFSQLTIDV